MASPSPNSKNFPEPYTYEDAIALAKSGPFHYVLLLTCGLCFLSFMSQVVIVTMVLPFVICDLPATRSEEGLLAAASFFGVVFSSHVMGFLGDTWGRIRTLKLSLSTSLAFAFISVFSVNVWMLIVTRFLCGFFIAGCQSCTYSLCGEFHSNKTRSRYLTLISIFLNVALIFTSLLAILILPNQIDWHISSMKMSSWRFLLLAVNIAPIVALILICYTPETPKFDLIHNNDERALKTLQKIYNMNAKKRPPDEEFPVRSIQLEETGYNLSDIKNCCDALRMIWRQTAPIFNKQRVWHSLNICLLLFTLYGISHGLVAWYPIIIHEEIKRPNDYLCNVITEAAESSNEQFDCNNIFDSLTFWLMAIIGAFFTVVHLTFSFTIGIIGKRNAIIIWLCFCGAISTAAPFVANLPLAVIILIIIPSVGILNGIVATIAVEYYPTNISAMSICLLMMIGRLGAAIGSYLFRLLLFGYCSISFWIVAVVSFLLAAMSWLLPEKKRERKVKQ